MRETRELAVEFDDVEMRFGAIRALRGIDMKIAQGSLTGLIGPNGAGKTTTLRILATDLEPTAGRVSLLNGSLPRDTLGLRRRIGYAPERAGLYEELTLSEYLDFFATFYGVPAPTRAVGVAMELVGIESFADRRLQGMSKGEQQRVMLARALVHDPEFLILDEPADGLDPGGRVELRELLLLLKERGKTILVSSHILADLEEICSDLVLLNRGRVLFEGSRDQLISQGLRRSRIRLVTLDDNDLKHATEILSTVDDIRLEEVSSTLQIDAPPDADLAHAMLKRLVDGGVRVTSYERSFDTLEQIYLRLMGAMDDPEP